MVSPTSQTLNGSGQQLVKTTVTLLPSSPNLTRHYLVERVEMSGARSYWPRTPGCLHAVKAMVEAGADLEYATTGQTALHAATGRGKATL